MVNPSREYFIKWVTLRSTISNVVLFILLLIFLFPAYRPYLEEAFSKFYLNENVNNMAESITKGSVNSYDSIEKIFEWQQKNMKNIYGRNCKIPFFGNCLIPFCVRLEFHKNPSWVLFSKCGACEEYTLIFTELANSIGIEARSIHHHGGDHNWVEVLIDGKWVIVNPASPPFYRNTSSFGKISYLYALDKDGNKEEITSRYTKTNRLIVFVFEGSNLSKQSKIKIEAKKEGRYIPTDNEDYKCNKELCEFELGENEYRVTAIIGGWFKHKDSQNINLNESVKAIYLKPRNIDWNETLNPTVISIIVLFSLGIISWVGVGLFFSFLQAPKTKI